ncbi:hypothetical protein LOAG_18116 [Loa loa]|uniref:Uncharacterized protein n=1 Tax=Loa loa TaxID=7209 RepID=A0A1S0UG64_LOALO|nr:hypothetical protein LOAG_18116 [Loa loa]EJD74579.1 hypothetical protein LOAG_18116 [Loa loa]
MTSELTSGLTSELSQDPPYSRKKKVLSAKSFSKGVFQQVLPLKRQKEPSVFVMVEENRPQNLVRPTRFEQAT